MKGGGGGKGERESFFHEWTDPPTDRTNGEGRKEGEGGEGATHPALFSSLGVGGAVRRGGVEYYLEERKGGPIDHAKIGGRGGIGRKALLFFLAAAPLLCDLPPRFYERSPSLFEDE